MPNDNDENEVYRELIGFLKSDRPDLKTAAVDAVSRVSDREGVEKLIKHGVVDHLTKCCSHPDPVGLGSLQALVYFSSFGPSASQCVEDLLDAGALQRMIEICLSSKEGGKSFRKRINFAMSLLVNMTRTERGAVELVGRTLATDSLSCDEQENGEEAVQHMSLKPTMELLLARFLSKQYVDEAFSYDDFEASDDVCCTRDGEGNDPYQHFAAVLMNSTQTQEGRRFVLRIRRSRDTTTSVVQIVLGELRSKNPIRRRGIAGTLKNCCLETESAWWLLEEVKITKHLLYPLAGPEELDLDEKRGMDPDLWLDGPDKIREPDHLTRLYLVESLLLLCASGRKSRESLRLARVYVILKLADMVEENEDVSEQINECVQFLRRDEHGTSEGSSDRFVEDSLPRAGTKLSTPSTVAPIGIEGDFDSID